MASATGHAGLGALLPLLRFIVAINLASIVFVVVDGVVARLARFSVTRLLVFLRDELLPVTLAQLTVG